jgi:MFS superfamily sulfate permease-like transporter
MHFFGAVKTFFSASNQKHVLIFCLFSKEYIEIFKNIAKTNIATLIISIVSCIFLYLIKHFVNERYKLKMPAPVPVELLLVQSCLFISIFKKNEISIKKIENFVKQKVVIGTVISYLCKFNYNYKVKTVGYLPLGYL